MKGAEALLQTLIDAGVEVCFANPGTSEMQLVAAIDQIEGMRPVLALFEGVATGAADGYGRMAEKPAATLLHLAPGLANGMANLHNAFRAGTPIINLIGDHATYHLEYDAPLTSDLEGHVKLQSGWYKQCQSVETIAGDGAKAVQAAFDQGGQIASLMIPADIGWGEGADVAAPLALPTRESVPASSIDAAVAALRTGEPTALILGGSVLREKSLEDAGKIAKACGATLFCETFPARIERGAGRVALERVPYLGEMASEVLKPFQHIILIGAKAPVSFFAYPETPSWLSPEGANIVSIGGKQQDINTALVDLVNKLGAENSSADVQTKTSPEVVNGKLTAEGIAASLCALMPEQAVVSDESNTCGFSLYPVTAGAAPHDWLALTGGSIGQGLPVAVGAAIACPDRKTIALQADGSAMYTVQSLWTMAREALDVTVVILNNGSYAILNFELLRVGVDQPGEKALSMLDLTQPAIDWVSLSHALGISAVKVSTNEDFYQQFEQAMQTKGPFLIEADLTF